MRFICDVDLDKITPDEMHQAVSDSPIDYKMQILDYLRHTPVVSYTTAPVTDAFTGEVFDDADNAHSDGCFTWYESEIYHFDKYNLKLNDDFIQYVLNRPD